MLHYLKNCGYIVKNPLPTGDFRPMSENNCPSNMWLAAFAQNVNGGTPDRCRMWEEMYKVQIRRASNDEFTTFYNNRLPICMPFDRRPTEAMELEVHILHKESDRRYKCAGNHYRCGCRVTSPCPHIDENSNMLMTSDWCDRSFYDDVNDDANTVVEVPHPQTPVVGEPLSIAEARRLVSRLPAIIEMIEVNMEMTATPMLDVPALDRAIEAIHLPKRTLGRVTEDDDPATRRFKLLEID